MEEAIDTLKYKGLIIKIYQDEDYRNPDDWEYSSVFLVSFHSDFSVRREGFEKEICQYLAGNKEQDESVIEKAKSIEKEYHIFGHDAYIHSGVVLALSYEGNFVDRRWDVSQLGLVFVSKKETKNRKKAKELARSLIKDWNDCLSGNVYGYVVENENGENLRSCWGFYGDIEESGIIEEAKAEARNIAKERMIKHLKGLKAQIKQGVSLEKRRPIKT